MGCKTVLGAVVVVTIICAPAVAQQRIGNADSVTKAVTGTVSGRTAPVASGDRVFQDQRLTTGRDSQAELTFLDKTNFTIGADSEVVLDTFIYNPGSRKGKMVLNASKGAFRFVSGLGRKKNYTVNTPTASIGIRGTIFHVFVLSTGTTAIALVKGNLRICNRAQTECRIATKPGRVTFVLISGRISKEMGWGENYMRHISIKRAFPFIRDHQPFRGTPTGGDTRIDHTTGGPDFSRSPEPESSKDFDCECG